MPTPPELRRALPAWNELAPVRGQRPHTLGARDDLGEKREPIHETTLGSFRVAVIEGAGVLWITLRNASGAGVALRGVYSPDGQLKIESLEPRDNGLALSLNGSTTGRFRAHLQLDDTAVHPVLRWSVWLTPHADLLMPPQPWNVYPIDATGSPIDTRGILHASQRGTAAGLLYFSITQPAAGSYLYFQNLTALNDYCDTTRTDPENVVAGNWPGLGFLPPTSDTHPLPAGRELSVCDAFISLTEELPESDSRASELFLELLEGIYERLPRPEPEPHDWQHLADQTAFDLTHSSKCSIEQQGHLYLHPYTSSEFPDAMVQLSVLLPMREYAARYGHELPIIDRLREAIPQFYHARLRTMVRYLSTVGSEKDPYEVDSWYFFHPLRNLALLAADGDDEARELFLTSVEYGIETARRFEYWWPILYHLETREVIRAEHHPREGGQTDVPGLYAYVMLQAWELTKEERYVEEAIKSVRRLDGIGFSIGYQFNNTAWGMVACLQLWQRTKDRAYLGRAMKLLASFVHNCNIWECNYGPARHFRTFMSVTCLHDGPYIAAYEEFEAFLAFHECFAVAGRDLPRSARVFMAEYMRHALDHFWYYYPGHLPPAILATEIRNGHIDRSLAIPLEDLYASWEPPGQVGQEIYGSGMAFAFSSRAYHRTSDMPFTIYCDYPIDAIRKAGDRAVQFGVLGDTPYRCAVHVLCKDPTILNGVRVEAQDGPTTGISETIRRTGRRQFDAPGDGQIRIQW
ncbi:MAG TPA: hypothetical protein PKB10_00410 [Tepidisphaeraceae bacterium]|mgnify:CR=1 FL=1|nr:hypothetical protein [Tepidisphaeraceae bacterium]